MPGNLRVQINQTVQINTNHVVQNQIAKDANIIKLIGRDEFIDLFYTYRPALSQQSIEHYLVNPDLFWDHLFGHIGWAVQHGQSKKAAYLTEESAHMILQNFEKFVSGFDFYNRPLGFLMLKNPQSGIVDVLHYSSYLHHLQKESPPNYLAITFDIPDSEPLLHSDHAHPFTGHQQNWYAAFEQKRMLGNGQITCTEQELRSAFIRFSQTIEEFGLEFYPPNFEAKFWKHPVNPVVLLARMETVLRNRHLKIADRNAQWEVILALHLENSDEAIRAISDHENDSNPCGILLPEMHLVKDDFLETMRINEELKNCWGFRSVIYPKQIRDIKDFWRYIAFQPNRHSMQFYRDALKAIQDITLISDDSKLQLIQLLAAGTTRFNAAPNAIEEVPMLAILVEMCGIINRWETMNPFSNMMQILMPEAEKMRMRNELVTHLCRLEEPPNIIWLSMIFGYIKHYFSQAVLDDTPLIQLSDKLNTVVSRLKMATYKGAKFLCTADNWLRQGIKDYIEMQERLCNTAGPLHTLLAAHLSSFNINDEEQYKQDIQYLHFQNQALLIFTLKILEDIQTNRGLQWQDLYTICLSINTEQLNTEIEVLNYLEQNFGHVFEENYFIEKKQRVLQALTDLDFEQLAFIDQLNFSAEQAIAVKQILSMISSNNPLLEKTEFQNLVMKFSEFTQVFASSEVSKFFNNLAEMDSLITDQDGMGRLLNLLMEKRKLTDFEHIYFRNKLVQNSDNLLEKFIYYISFVQPIIDEHPVLGTASLQTFLTTYILHADAEIYDEAVVIDMLKDLETIIQANPHIQEYIFLSLQNISENNSPDYTRDVFQFVSTLKSIHKLLPVEDGRSDIQNMQIFYTLLAKYTNNPQAFVALFTLLQEAGLDSIKIKFIIPLISRLLEENQSLESIQMTVEYIISLDSERYQQFVPCYQYPPYAPIQTWNEWSQEPETLLDKYNEFCLTPFGARKLDYAFDLQHYHRQKLLFNGLIQNGEPFSSDLFTDDLGQRFDVALAENRQKSIPNLRQSYKDACTRNDKFNMLCAAIELLARTTSQKDLVSESQISQEMNTTQVMAAYASLIYPNAKLQIEMDTGEGKSRVLMVLAACKTHLGFTSDFITADFQLAERDYFAHKSFFTSLNIPTSLITLATPELLYQYKGVNFSDNEQLQLVRNKSDIINKPFAFLNPDPAQRCLLLDEIDKFKKDKSQYACNYAAQSIKFQEFTWIYSHLVQFMLHQNNPGPEILERSDYQAMIDTFLTYLTTHETDPVRIAQSYALHHAHSDQFSIWLHSADLAIKKMKQDKDYAITEKMSSVQDGEGRIRLSKKALVLNNGRPVEGALFSDGVHQCLLALLNIQAGNEQYVIPPEIETQRTSYSITFMEKYDEGQIVGASGTTRSAGPIADPIINYENYGYLSVPRERPLRRDDKNIWVAKDQRQQIAFIKAAILEKLAQGLPILIICKDDNQSLALYTTLSQDPELAAQFTRVHGLTTNDAEKAAIKRAGQSRQITFSTAGMFSRGVDIEADNLFVISAYVPTLEDEIQIKGRTARAGKPGEYRMIPDLANEDAQLDGNTYNIYNEVDKYQKRLALEAEFQESVNTIYALLLEEITQAFLQTRPSPDQTELWLLKWQSYLNKMQKNWENNSEALLTILHQGNKEQFLSQFQEITQKWRTKLQQIFPEAPINDNGVLEDKTIKIFDSAAHQLTFFQPKRHALKIQHNYDPSDDGQARIYDSLFVETIACLRGERDWFADYNAWRDGRGALFPNLIATLNGERPLFADLIATINRWLGELKEFYQSYFVEEPENEVDLPILAY